MAGMTKPNDHAEPTKKSNAKKKKNDFIIVILRNIRSCVVKKRYGTFLFLEDNMNFNFHFKIFAALQ